MATAVAAESFAQERRSGRARRHHTRSETGHRAHGILVLAGSLAAMAFALADPSAGADAPAPAPTIRVEKAWIRWLPTGVPAGGYLTLTNTGDRALILIDVSSPAFGEVMLHRTRNRAGTVEMLPVERITIEAHTTLDFASLGYHLMLMQESKPLRPGDRVPITLRFEDGATLTVSFEVRP